MLTLRPSIVEYHTSRANSFHDGEHTPLLRNTSTNNGAQVQPTEPMSFRDVESVTSANVNEANGSGPAHTAYGAVDLTVQSPRSTAQ